MGARRVEVLQNAAAVDRFPQAPMAGSAPGRGLRRVAPSLARHRDDRRGVATPGLLGAGAARHRGRARRESASSGSGPICVGAVPPARVPELLAGADIGLAPYGLDAPRYFSPIKLFEYLAAGLATVVADLPAVESGRGSRYGRGHRARGCRRPGGGGGGAVRRSSRAAEARPERTRRSSRRDTRGAIGRGGSSRRRPSSQVTGPRETRSSPIERPNAMAQA